MLLCASYSDIGGRKANEDSVAVFSDGAANLCAALADGLGGHGGGDAASGTVVNTVIDGWAPGGGAQMLAQLVSLANERVLAMQSDACKMKSTIAALSVEGPYVAWAYVGDSRLYRFEGGALAWQSKDHSASQLSVIMGQITPDQIRTDDGRGMLYKVVGQEEDLRPETGSLVARNNAYVFLLCSDGFWEYVLEEDMVRTLAQSRTPNEWIALMRGIHDHRCSQTCDNNSAITVWLTV